ncbi:rna-directed dna polymerase from mobile element jockey-like [Pitangus sulphuratus]|nr:rna-directed dna polymerase from mobile element jockey-like [Pitangus sulphuratus]
MWVGYELSSESVTSERLENTDRVEKLIEDFTYDSIYAIEYELVAVVVVVGGKLLIECILSKFASDTKLCGVVDTLEGKDAIQRDLARLERWPLADLMKFKKDKCNVLHLGLHHPKHKHSLVGEWIESSLVKKHLIVLIDEKPSMTWQCVLAVQKANCVLGSTKRSASTTLREVILLFSVYSSGTPKIRMTH